MMLWIIFIKYIDTDINIDDLSIEFKIIRSFHLHRIFKDEFGKIYESIKSIRLRKEANLFNNK